MKDLQAELREFSRQITERLDKYPPPSEAMSKVCRVCHGSGWARYFYRNAWEVRRCKGWQGAQQYVSEAGEAIPAYCAGTDYNEWVQVNKKELVRAIFYMIHKGHIEEEQVVRFVLQMTDSISLYNLSLEQLEQVYYYCLKENGVSSSAIGVEE